MSRLTVTGLTVTEQNAPAPLNPAGGTTNHHREQLMHNTMAGKPDVSTRVETITPERAEELLGRNPRNRPIRLRVARDYARAMAAGEWEVTGQPIIIDSGGQVVDGQHRLRGCVEAGVSFTTLVVYGVPGKAQDYVDIGSRRSVADALGMRGYASATQLASALSYITLWQTHGRLRLDTRTYAFTPAMALRALGRHPGVEDAVRLTTSMKTLRRLAPPSGVAAAMYIALQVDPDLVQRFLEGIDAGIGLTSGDPRLAARERLIRESTAVSPSVPVARLWMVWRALVAFARDEPLQKMQVPPSLFSAQAWLRFPGDRLRGSLAHEDA